MIRIRWELQAARDGHQKVYAALKKACDAGAFPIPGARVSASRFGTCYRFAVEWDVADYSSLDAFSAALRGEEKLDPLWNEIHPFLETGDTTEIWEVIS